MRHWSLPKFYWILEIQLNNEKLFQWGATSSWHWSKKQKFVQYKVQETFIFSLVFYFIFIRKWFIGDRMVFSLKHFIPEFIAFYFKFSLTFAFIFCVPSWRLEHLHTFAYDSFVKNSVIDSGLAWRSQQIQHSSKCLCYHRWHNILWVKKFLNNGLINENKTEPQCTGNVEEHIDEKKVQDA